MIKKMELRHPLWLRLLHWSNMISITMLVLTGFYIHAPQTFGWLFKNMDNARTTHFAFAMVLFVGVVVRLYMAFATGDWRNISICTDKRYLEVSQYDHVLSIPEERSSVLREIQPRTERHVYRRFCPGIISSI